MIPLERRDGRPLRIGHRGAAAIAPENTLEAFRAAVETGVDLVEFDVLALRAGELVVAHSTDLHEVSHGAARGSLARMTFADLRAVCPRLPTLDEALRYFREEAPDTGAHLDLKSPQAAAAVVDSLARQDLLERAFLSTFDVPALRTVAALEPRLRIGVSFPRGRAGVDRREWLGGVVAGGLRVLRGLTPRLVEPLLRRSHATTLVLQHTLVTPAAVARAHALGAPVVAWTVDDAGDLARVEKAGVDAVVTNDPSIFVSTLKT